MVESLCCGIVAQDAGAGSQPGESPGGGAGHAQRILSGRAVWDRHSFWRLVLIFQHYCLEFMRYSFIVSSGTCPGFVLVCVCACVCISVGM